MKKMALTLTIASVVLVGLVVLALGHFHRGHAHSGPHGKAYIVEKVTKELQLDADQQAQLEEFISRLHEKRESGQEFRQTLRADLLAALQQEQLDRGELDRIYTDAKQKLDTVYDLFATEMVDFHQTLSAEQRDKLVTKIEDHHQRRRDFMGRGCRWKE